MKTYEELSREALKLRCSPTEAPGRCQSCRSWQVAQTQATESTLEMMCGQSRNMSYGLHGQDGKAIITPAKFGCVLYTPGTDNDAH